MKGMTIWNLFSPLNSLSRRKLGLAGRIKYTPHQGEQEKARRVRQIQAGIITVSPPFHARQG